MHLAPFFFSFFFFEFRPKTAISESANFARYSTNRLKKFKKKKKKVAERAGSDIPRMSRQMRLRLLWRRIRAF